MTARAPASGTAADRPDRLLVDPALAEALAVCAASGRLSDDDIRQMRRARRRGIASVGAALLVAAVGTSVWQFAPSKTTTTYYETQRGEQRSVRLPDGSHLRLSGATRIAVSFVRGRRDVTLDRGEAFFDVAHDRTRPFTVHAAASGARVLGTAFDVDVRQGQVALAVYRGAVHFGRENAPNQGVVVGAGWRSQFDGATAAAPRRFDPTQQDWREGWLDTDGMRLSDLVDALNRQGGPLVLPPPPELATIAVAGRFRPDGPAQLLEAIGGAYGFSVKHDGATLRLTAI